MSVQHRTLIEALYRLDMTARALGKELEPILDRNPGPETATALTKLCLTLLIWSKWAQREGLKAAIADRMERMGA